MAESRKLSRGADIIASVLAVLLLPASLFSRRRSAKVAPTASSFSRLPSELTVLSQKIAAHALRLKIHEVVTQARPLLNSLQAHSDGISARQEDVGDCLLSATAETRRFASLTPHLTDPADPRVVRLNDILSCAAQTLAAIHEELTRTQRSP